ncbi:MAG: helix-turn-helix transcriptional regulator [Oscillospiraceae bacterium]
MKQFSSRLISLRKEREWTQADLAQSINKTRSTVSGYETEGKEPDFETLCTLAETFGVSSDYLLGKSDSRTHSGDVFKNDNVNLKKCYKALPAELKETVAGIYDNFYLLINRDMKFQNAGRLALYGELLSTLQSSRSEIRKILESNALKQDAVFISSIMTMQSDLKSNISSLLDRLMQEDLNCSQSVKLYRAAHSKNNAEPKIIENEGDILGRLAAAPAVKKETDL